MASLRGNTAPTHSFSLPHQSIRIPNRIQTPTQNLLIRPLSSNRKTQKQMVNQLGKAMNMTTLSELKRLSINSLGQQQQPHQANPQRKGFKFNRIRMLGVNNFPKKYTTHHKESLYQKSLRKTHSAFERKDFEESVKEITAKQFLCSKKSLLTYDDPQRRIKTEMCQPESATIIIELKRLFNNRGEYSFVHNHYYPPIQDCSTAKDDQIFSTTHTCLNDNDRPMSQTHSLYNRTSKTQCKLRKQKKEKMSKENELIPWFKQTERAFSELDFQPFLPE